LVDPDLAHWLEQLLEWQQAASWVLLPPSSAVRRLALEQQPGHDTPLRQVLEPVEATDAPWAPWVLLVERSAVLLDTSSVTQ
jgi:hypothetical protein